MGIVGYLESHEITPIRFAEKELNSSDDVSRICDQAYDDIFAQRIHAHLYFVPDDAFQVEVSTIASTWNWDFWDVANQGMEPF